MSGKELGQYCLGNKNESKRKITRTILWWDVE